MKDFGGAWTTKKLQCLEQYVMAYEKVMKNQKFTLLYIDAFAGAGYRVATKNKDISFISDFQKGSPRIILESTNIFDTYILIEKDLHTFQRLKKLGDDFPDKKISFQNKDANTYIKELCSTTDWNTHRAILFLDPFAMEVEWDTISIIAKTKAVDLWVLFPAMAVNRLLFKKKETPKKLRNQLDKLFGSAEWKDNFYQPSQQLDLFAGNSKEKTASFEEIKGFFLKQLRTIFSGVADNPLPLKNSKKSILFYLFFAVGNAKGEKVALRIAQHILGQQ